MKTASALSPEKRRPNLETKISTESQAYDLLRRYWGYAEFLPQQRDAVLSVCAGRDTLIVLPTGGGKSLCFQLPALMCGRAVVVSPLISLMQDQVVALRQAGIHAGALNSSVSQADAGKIMAQWRSGELKLLYLAPERLVLSVLLNFLVESPPSFFAVDEAHCISHWGHDFRPEYRGLKMLRERFAGVAICALTATATQVVRNDIAAELGLNEPAIYVGDFDRPNLHYRVERRHDRNSQVQEVIAAHAGKSGIVYCISRKDAEAVAEYLRTRGHRAAAYHAGMPQDQRRKVQAEFTNEQLDAVVATVAFGMGIDRSNVRFVIHAGLPASVENYQQETGRAGRDGLPAECVLLFSPADVMKWRSIYEKDELITEEQLKIRLGKLSEIDRFASSHGCRHKYLVEYFGQQWAKGNCGNCDNCSDTPSASTHPESTVIAQKILSCVARLNEGYGAGYVIKVLRGETEQVQPLHCGLSTFALLADHPFRRVKDWIEECVSQNLLSRSDGTYPVLQITADGWELLRGKRTARLSAEITAAPRDRRAAKGERIRKHREHADIGLSDSEKELFEKLRKMRQELAKSQGVPAYVIFHDSVLAAIAANRPRTREELAAIPGMGSAKLSTYAAVVLKTVAEFTTGSGE